MKWEEHSENLKQFKMDVAKIIARQMFSEMPNLLAADFQDQLVKEIIQYDLVESDVCHGNPKIPKMVEYIVNKLKTEIATKVCRIRYK